MHLQLWHHLPLPIHLPTPLLHSAILRKLLLPLGHCRHKLVLPLEEDVCEPNSLLAKSVTVHPLPHGMPVLLHLLRRPGEQNHTEPLPGPCVLQEANTVKHHLIGSHCNALVPLHHHQQG